MGLNIKIPVFVCSSSGLSRSPLYLGLYQIQGLVLNEPLNLSPTCYCIKIALRFFYMMTNLHHYLKIMIDLSNMHHQLRLSTLSLHTTTSLPIFTPLCHFPQATYGPQRQGSPGLLVHHIQERIYAVRDDAGT